MSSATARPFPLAAVFAVTITILLAALYFAVATARAAEGTIVEGPLAADQSAAGADQTSYPAATPTPVSGTGQTGSYTREPWSEEEVGGENGLSVVSSTASGTFALTGIVLDGDTGAPVQGAAVRLVDPCPTCYRPERAAALGPPGGPVTVAAATTDGAGSFAFINISPLPRLDLTVTKTGYGSYAVQSIHYSSDETYVTTVELGPTQQTYNESGTKADSTLTAASVGSGYDSNGRVPPSLQVAQFPQAPDCSAAGSLRRVRRYPWRFYVLHTMSGEIFGSGFEGGFFKIAAAKANAQAIQSYAWYHRIRGGNAAGGADVDNTTNFQCFKPYRPVRRVWRGWVEDILNERIADSNNDIQLTQYRRGSYSCVEGGIHAPNGNILSQLGSKAREEQCGVNDWRNIDNWYYTGNVTGGLLPPRPQTSFSQITGGIRFHFESKVGNSLVGWRYQLERFVGPPVGWSRIHNRGWSWTQRAVPTSFTFATPGTWKYRVRGCNPVGCSGYASYNREEPISPGPGPGGGCGPPAC